MTAQDTISEVTRRDIIDYFRQSGITWAGRLSEPDFLARLFDLSELPSDDPRFKDARGDIIQHRVEFTDWEDDWVFKDHRFAILWVSDKIFMRFLCETLHPIVRPNPADARDIAAQLNRFLALDGWELFEESELSGRPIYGARRSGHRAVIFAEPTGWKKVDKEIELVRLGLEAAVSEEQFQTVGLLCREVLISVAQVVYDHGRHGNPKEQPPSSTDASPMLERFFSTELQGATNDEVRAFAKKALTLALALQHKRTADYRMAALCAEAASSVVNIAAIVSGRRQYGAG